MSQSELVRITVYQNGDGDRLGYVWGLYRATDDEDFFPLYTRSKEAAADLNLKTDDLGQRWLDIGDDEVDSRTPVDQCWTPKLVYGLAMKAAMEGKL